MPYSLEVNDSIVHAIQLQQSDDMLARLEATLETFELELEDQPRVLAIGLHPHLIGVPHRFAHFERMLDMLVEHPRATFMTGSGIADWFESACDPEERRAVELTAAA